MQTEYLISPDPSEERGRQGLAHAAEIIRRGGLVVFPTETVYGLGGNATRADAASAIYRAKGRPSDNPLIIHIAKPENAERYTVTSALYYRLAEAFMPGPLTVILPVKESIPKEVTAGLSTVAVRCPAHKIAHALIEAAGVPIAAPSANLSGSPSPTCFAHVKDDMDGRVDMIIDGGNASIGVESTIVKIERDETLTLLRPGFITVDDLHIVTPHITVADAVTGALKPGETVLSPGMKYRHYAPQAPLYLIKADNITRQKYYSAQNGCFAILAYREELDALAAHPAHPVLYDLGPEHSPEIHAQRLFTLLREADKGRFDRIYAPLPEKEGLSLALYNRMIRAAAYQIIEPND